MLLQELLDQGADLSRSYIQTLALCSCEGPKPDHVTFGASIHACSLVVVRFCSCQFNKWLRLLGEVKMVPKARPTRNSKGEGEIAELQKSEDLKK